MGRILIAAIVLYLLFLVGYLVWERRVKRRRNAARRNGKSLFSAPPTEDIIGKSGFVLSHSLPQATTLTESEKPLENASIFAAGNGKTDEAKPSAMIPDDKLDELFSSAPTTDPDEVDYAFDDRPDGDENEIPDGYEETVDAEESESGNDDEGTDDAPTTGAMATGLKFEELSGMSRTVNDPGAATAAERHEAGRVLTEVRQTDMFEQVVSGQPEKRVSAGKLMDDYIADWHRRRRERGEDNEPGVKAPDDFDPRAFAR